MDTPENRDLLGELLRIGVVCLPSAKREGWQTTKIDGQSLEYIVDREACVEALIRLRKIPWQSVDCESKPLALEILDNVNHALTVMRDAMARNEPKML